MADKHYESAIKNTLYSRNNDITEKTVKSGSKTTRPDPMILKIFQFGFKIGGLLSPALAGRIAYNLWLTPTRFKTPTSEKNALATADVSFLSVKQHSIATFSWGYTESSAKPVVLLVHGWRGRGTQLGAFVEPLIQAGYQVISFDAPAHGQSSGKQTNLYQIADIILALQKRFGQFDSMITHSFGGPCAALAMVQGLKSNHFVSICPPASTFGLVEKFVSTLHITQKTRDHLLHRIEETFGKDIWKELAMTNMVNNIACPGFVIHDAQDVDIPWEEGQAVAYAWNNAAFKITSGLGHRRILRDKAVIEAAVKFIQNKKITN